MLQGTILDGSGAFRSGTLSFCTEWPRTVMRGALRKENSGPNSVPKPARRTEPSPRFSRFAARPKGVAAQRRVWGSQEGAREPYGALAPFCPRRGHGVPRPPKAATVHAHFERKVASSGAPLYRRKVCRQQAVKNSRGRCPLATYLKFRLSRTRFYKTIQKSRSRPRAAHGLQMNACEKRANVL